MPEASLDNIRFHSSGRGESIGVRIMTFVKTFLRDESGASAAEYALILAIVGAAIVIGAVTLGEAIGTELNDTATCIGSKSGEFKTNCK